MTYNEALEISRTFKPARPQHDGLINRENPMPLPECRLNEFACLINRETTMEQCIPNGTVPLFATTILDTADAWFKSLFLKGYKFKNYDINTDCTHGYYLNGPGQDSQRSSQKYSESESFAKKYYEDNFK